MNKQSQIDRTSVELKRGFDGIWLLILSFLPNIFLVVYMGRLNHVECVYVKKKKRFLVFELALWVPGSFTDSAFRLG